MTNVERLIELGILEESDKYLPGGDVKSTAPFQAKWGTGFLLARETIGSECKVETNLVRFKDSLHTTMPTLLSVVYTMLQLLLELRTSDTIDRKILVHSP